MKRIFQLLAFCIISSFLLASCSSTPLPTERKAYAGYWSSEDGSTIDIETSGSAGYWIGATRVRGGSISFTDTSFSIGIFGMNKYFKVDSPPAASGEVTVMKLNGMEYKRVNW